jgi:hypothetical protein
MTGRALSRCLPKKLVGRLSPPVSRETFVRVKPHLRDEQVSLLEDVESVQPSKEDADVVIYMTDLPGRDNRLPIAADFSAEHRFGLIFVAGVGAAAVARRVLDLVILPSLW